ncbi:MAG: murein biosynthesis integral membrane protein MurJ [Planctomycetaceae bacterium]|nr:murein biosynthesis integral membrane protein MurJ [Planctomycetaceae bacterium]
MIRSAPTLTRRVLIVYWLALAVGSHWPRLYLGDNAALPFGVDKWLHVGGYAGLIFLLLSARFFGRRGMRAAILPAVAILLIYALIDELTQHFVPGRSVTFLDYVASCIGLTIGLGCWFLWHQLQQLRQAGDPTVTHADEHPGPDPQPQGTNPQSFVAHTRIVAALTLLSRVFGLVRDWALAFAIGFTSVLDAWVIAFMIPNLFRRLFGEGALAAAFIPHYAKLHQRDPDQSRRFAALVLLRFGALLVVICGVGLLILAAMHIWGGFQTRGLLTVQLTMTMLPYMLLVCGVAIVGAMLQVHSRFAPAAAAPVVLNILIITAALIGALAIGDALSSAGRAQFVAVAVLCAGLIQITWALLALRAAGVRLFTAIQPLGDQVRSAWSALLRQWLPTVLGLAVFQINVLADALIAMGFSAPAGRETFALLGYELTYPMREGAVGVLGAAARLYEFPLGVFGIAVATAIFPALARAAGDRDAFTGLLRQGLRLTVFIGLPASVGLMLVREPLTRAIYYAHGSIVAADAARIASVLLGYAPAVWAYSMNHVLTRGFYAHHDPVTPMRVSLVMVALNIVLNLTLIWLPVRGGETLGAAGLAWSTAICAMIQCAILLRLSRRHTGPLVDRAVARSWALTAVISVAMAAAVILFLQLPDLSSLTHAATIFWLILTVAVGIGMVIGSATLCRMGELGWLWRRSSPDRGNHS